MDWTRGSRAIRNTIEEPWVIVLALAHNYERLRQVPSDATNGVGVTDIGDQYGLLRWNVVSVRIKLALYRCRRLGRHGPAAQRERDDARHLGWKEKKEAKAAWWDAVRSRAGLPAEPMHAPPQHG